MQLVNQLAESGAIRTEAIRQAFLAVPREAFVGDIATTRGLESVYADLPIVTKEIAGWPVSSSSQPSVMAEMLEAADIRDGQCVLEIGLGTGYNAALLSLLVGASGRVTSVDVDHEVAAEANASLRRGGYAVETVVGDGRAGWAAGAPYDRIVATGSMPIVPEVWHRQLADDGLIVAPLQILSLQLIVVLRRTPHGLESIGRLPGGFMALRETAEHAATDQAVIQLRLDDPQIGVSGAGLSHLNEAERSRLATHVTARSRRDALTVQPAWPAIWHVLLSTDESRQVAMYRGRTGLRLGLVDPAGGLAVLHAARDGSDWSVVAVETYGPAEEARSRLLDALHGWYGCGAPTLDDLRVDINYDPAHAAPAWSMHTLRQGSATLSVGWNGAAAEAINDLAFN